MATSRHEFEQRAVNIMRGIFEARWEAGQSAGQAFEAARRAAIGQLKTEARVASEVDFGRFARGYLVGIEADTVRMGAQP